MSGCPHLSSKSRVCDFREVHKEPDLCKMGVAKESGLGGRSEPDLARWMSPLKPGPHDFTEGSLIINRANISVPGETVHKLL
ncbi:hypothetical protein PGT21_022886 [Puccinia graminis f. sp. tritici]|uniref:Uncharacterized protein n=1 Tax=Puccinia graminis f. sp. tritici TaxID=56615 RepID=A0A5B0M0U2_PUCGR|nr:hypothetical protein PGT21_022886 [Puccinia graminis f. sp. tritici]